MLVAPVSVGEDAATGAGSVVTKDVAPNSIAVGAPCQGQATRRVRRRRAAVTGFAHTSGSRG